MKEDREKIKTNKHTLCPRHDASCYVSRKGDHKENCIPMTKTFISISIYFFFKFQIYIFIYVYIIGRNE